jgi:RNA polymerase sigma-70 factor (family 1)
MLYTRNRQAAAVKVIQGQQVLDSETAFKEIYAMFWKKLFSIAYSRLNEKQEAEDVVHDVFVSLWVNRDKIEIRSLEQYLATAVKYLILTKLKKKEHQRKYCQSVENSNADECVIENVVHNKHMLETVNSGIEELPEKCRLIFKCSRHDGMPVKKIAEQLSISPKTVENHLSKALKHLRGVAKTFLC